MIARCGLPNMPTSSMVLTFKLAPERLPLKTFLVRMSFAIQGCYGTWEYLPIAVVVSILLSKNSWIKTAQ